MDPIKEAEEVMAAYAGDISRGELAITLSATNALTKKENVETKDGIKFVERIAKVECRVTVSVRDGVAWMEADESSCSILGGLRASYTANDLRGQLRRYRFAKKAPGRLKYAQMTLF